MAVSWFSGVLLPEHGYQPRHRSVRRPRNGVDGSDDPWFGDSPELVSTLPGVNASPGTPEFGVHNKGYDLFDQVTFSEIRRVLEGCAIDDPTTVVPELVQLIAHSSHTPDTLAGAWSEFEEATRDVYALRLRMRDWSAFFELDQPDEPEDSALALMLGYADDAWQLITHGSLQASTALH